MDSLNLPHTQLRRWHPCLDAGELAERVASATLHAAREAIARCGQFHIVLAGGRTPQQVYELLRHANADWHAWHIYFGDERCLPADHPERNSRMAALALLDHVPVPAAQIHMIHGELGPVRAAASYAPILCAVTAFDLVLLGLGEDGHTASLFPGHDLGTADSSPATLPIHNAPKPPPQRVSLSAHRLGAARAVIFLVSGIAKRAAVAEWRANRPIPAAAITPDSGVDIYVEMDLLQG